MDNAVCRDGGDGEDGQADDKVGAEEHADRAVEARLAHDKAQAEKEDHREDGQRHRDKDCGCGRREWRGGERGGRNTRRDEEKKQRRVRFPPSLSSAVCSALTAEEHGEALALGAAALPPARGKEEEGGEERGQKGARGGEGNGAAGQAAMAAVRGGERGREKGGLMKGEREKGPMMGSAFGGRADGGGERERRGMRERRRGERGEREGARAMLFFVAAVVHWAGRDVRGSKERKRLHLLRRHCAFKAVSREGREKGATVGEGKGKWGWLCPFNGQYKESKSEGDDRVRQVERVERGERGRERKRKERSRRCA